MAFLVDKNIGHAWDRKTDEGFPRSSFFFVFFVWMGEEIEKQIHFFCLNGGEMEKQILCDVT